MWIVVADGGQARFITDETDTLTLVPGAEYTADSRASVEIGSDRPGRAFDSAGQGRHSMEPPTDPHRHEKRSFATHIADALDTGLKKNAFDKLTIVAPPQALGDLRRALSPAVSAKITAEINKDLTNKPLPALVEQLRELLSI
jgi:protein required for attachment to host cells